MIDPVVEAEAIQLGEQLRRQAAQLQALANQLEGLGVGDPDLLRRGEEEMRSLLSAAPPRSTQRPASEEVDGLKDEEDPTEAVETELDELQATIAQGMALLEEHRSRSKQTEERWTDLQDQAVRSARAVPRPSLSGKQYPDYGSMETRVDVRF